MSTKALSSASALDISAYADTQAVNSGSTLSQRLRDSAGRLGWTQAKLAEKSGVPIPRVSDYWKGPKQPSAEYLFALANALGVSAEWLALGRERSSTNFDLLMSAEGSDWIEVPRYDLHQVSDTGLGEPTLRVPMRKDWLYANLRVSSELWLTQLLSDYRPAHLHEGSIVICRTVTRRELAEGHVCLWRFDSNIVVGHYSVVPDAMLARGLSASGLPLGSGTAILGDSSYRDLVVAPSQIGDGDNSYHLVGRILGIFLRPI